MENKLTIEHIQNYPLFELEFSHFDDERGIKSICKITEIREGEVTLLNTDYEYYELIEDLEPLLIPLSELIPQLAEWMKITNIFSFEKNEIQYISWWLKEILRDMDECPFIVCRKIFELHGDFHNLIDQGLALNKLNVK